MLQAEMYRDAFQVLRARTLPSLSHGAETPQHDKYDSNFVVYWEDCLWAYRKNLYQVRSVKLFILPAVLKAKLIVFSLH